MNKMSFNETKFEHLQYFVRPGSQGELHFLTEQDKQILKPEAVKDLGIWMDHEANFKKHLETTVSKARKQAGWAMKAFDSRSRETMMTLFKSKVLPTLEYCSQLWSPAKLGEIRKIETVQRNFTHKIDGLREKSYWERLKCLGVYSLERRRDRYSILYVYKIIIGLAPNFEDERFQIKTKINARRGRFRLIPAISRTATRGLNPWLINRSLFVASGYSIVYL